MSDVLTCRDFIEFLEAYRDGMLDAGVAERFRSHMEACPACEAYLATFERTVELVRETCCEGTDDIPSDVPPDLIRAILDARDGG